ncbi:MAG: hypothetical protein ABMA64_14660 [Myxococcota bacterium]
MRLEWMTLWFAMVSSAAPPSGEVLRNYVPTELGRIDRSGDAVIQPDGAAVSATYLDLSSRRTIAVSIATVSDPVVEKAKYKVWGDGQSPLRTASGEFGGFVVAGVPGGYFWTETSGIVASEAVVLIGDALLVKVAVTPAKDAEEPTRLLKELDLAGLRKLLP